MDTARASSRFFLGLGLGVALAAPVVSLAEITIPSNPFVGGDPISADQMNDYMNQLRTHLQGELLTTDYVPYTTFDNTEPQVVAELQTAADLNTIGGPVRVEFVPRPFSGVGTADPGFVQASSGMQYCAAYFEIQRQTDGGEWVSVGHHALLGGSAQTANSCTVRTPPGALSVTDTTAVAGAHRYRLRTWSEGGYAGNSVLLKDVRMVVYEIRGVLPAG
jgi:hypothetical protein